jgi:YHS domain-containing protein
MSPGTCDHCGTPFDPTEWHPAHVSATDGSVHGFCSEACKRTFVKAGPTSEETRKHTNGADTD